jgi:riboflavin synthase
MGAARGGRQTGPMFTGLVEARVQVRRAVPQGTGLRLQIPRPGVGFDAQRGDSISVSGCCLTVAGFAEEGRPQVASDLLFDLSAETLARTWFSASCEGCWVNLERSLRLGDRLGGHLVSGHVDGMAEVISVAPTGDGGARLVVEVAPGLERYLVPKGSVALDGVSLTVVEPEGRRCSVALIAETLERTSLGRAARGDRLHVEADQIGKWIERLLAER